MTATPVPGDHRADTHWDVVVVGAGLGGLSTAAFLATHGRRVLVLEQNEFVGGCAQAFRRHGDRYEFDVGAHHVGECEPGGRMRTLLGSLGIDDQIEWVPLDTDGFSRITAPGVEFLVPTTWDAYEERLIETFPAQEAGLRRCVDVLRTVARELKAPLPTGPLAPVRRAWASRTLLRWERRPLSSLFDACDLSADARLVIAGENVGYSAPPSKVTVGVHAGGLDHHLVSGAWRPRGGSQVLPTRLAEVITAHGGEVHTQVQVDRIMVENGRAIGVTLLDGTEIHADAVVSNADPRRTYLGLIGRENLPPRLLRRAEKMEMALPLVTVHLALDIDLHDRLPHATQWIHPHTDLETMYAAAYDGHLGTQLPVLMTSRTHTAPAGHSTLTLVSVAPPQYATWGLVAGGPIAGERYSHNERYLAAKETVTETVIDTACLVLPDLRDHIVHRETSTPITHERFTLATHGSAYGLAMTRDQTGRGRPDVRTPIDGLHLTGAGTRHMHGVVSTVHGGARTADAVLRRGLG